MEHREPPKYAVVLPHPPDRPKRERKALNLTRWEADPDVFARLWREKNDYYGMSLPIRVFANGRLTVGTADEVRPVFEALERLDAELTPS